MCAARNIRMWVAIINQCSKSRCPREVDPKSIDIIIFNVVYLAASVVVALM
jgi:hypothetical protein